MSVSDKKVGSLSDLHRRRRDGVWSVSAANADERLHLAYLVLLLSPQTRLLLEPLLQFLVFGLHVAQLAEFHLNRFRNVTRDVKSARSRFETSLQWLIIYLLQQYLT